MTRAFTFLLVSFISVSIFAEVPSESLKLTCERLVVFKDGYGLVVKKGEATADAAGRVFTTEVPDGAILGCFWATSSDDKKILTMRAEWDERKDHRKTDTACFTVAELLRANVGKPVTLELTDKTEKGASLTQEGKLVEILDLPAEASLPAGVHPVAGFSAALGETATVSPTAFTTLISRDGVVTYGSFPPEAIANGGTLLRELAPRSGEFVVIERGETRTVLPVSHVQSVVGKDLATRMNRVEEVYSKAKRLTVEFGKESAGKPVSMHLFYFTPGLRWIPTYRVTGDLKDKADVALQGEILNDVTDVEHADLDLVVGVPNFRFKDSPSPLTLEKTLRTLMIADGRGNMANNSMVQSQFSNAYEGASRPGAAGPGQDMTMAPELAGAAGEQDLFVYSSKDFSLKKNARATMPLWQASAPLRHVYTYDMKPRRTRAGGSSVVARADGSGTISPLQIQMNQVWHQLELTNSSKLPWTTGAALMIRDMLPLGQDLLTYTSPGACALLPVTVAVDLRGTSEEQEFDRKQNALRFDGNDYALVKKKGTVTLVSYRKEKSSMRVSLSTGGQATAGSDDARIKLNDFHPDDWEESGLMHVNNHSDVSWEVTLDPGQTKTLTYEVQFYVR